MYCFGCGHAIGPADRFCGWCGRGTPPSTALLAVHLSGHPARFCHCCGEVMPLGAGHCWQCAWPVAGWSAAPSVLPAGVSAPAPGNSPDLETALLRAAAAPHRRILAGAFDALICAAPVYMWGHPAGLDWAGAVTTWIIFSTGYQLWGDARGRSLGKEMMGLRIVDERTGRRPGWRGATLRIIGTIAGALSPLQVGWAWAIWDRRRQGWHDKFARTLVVDEWAASR